MRRALLAACCLTGLSLHAHADDWNGAYAGVSVGAAILDGHWDATQAYDPDGLVIPFSSTPHADFNDVGVRAGIYGGYNWQLSSWVVGVELDARYSDLKDTVDRIPGIGLDGGGMDGIRSNTTVSSHWGGGVRARGGYLILPDLLLFGTAGLSVQGVEAEARCPSDTEVCNPGLGDRSKTNSTTRFGWTVGAGLEMLLAENWTARVEYRYDDFGTWSFRALDPVAGASFGADADLDLATHSISLGVSYRF